VRGKGANRRKGGSTCSSQVVSPRAGSLALLLVGSASPRWVLAGCDGAAPPHWRAPSSAELSLRVAAPETTGPGPRGRLTASRQQQHRVRVGSLPSRAPPKRPVAGWGNILWFESMYRATVYTFRTFPCKCPTSRCAQQEKKTCTVRSTVSRSKTPVPMLRPLSPASSLGLVELSFDIHAKILDLADVVSCEVRRAQSV